MSEKERKEQGTKLVKKLERQRKKANKWRARVQKTERKLRELSASPS